MNKKFLISVALWSFLCCSCQNKFHKILQNDYDLPDSIYRFFPKELDNNLTFDLLFHTTNAEKSDLPYFKEEFSTTFLVKIYKCKKTEKKDSLLNYWKKESLASFKSESQDYYIIGSERDLYYFNDSITIKKNFLKFQDKNLIVNFHDLLNEEPMFYDSTTTCGLPKDYKIEILKSGNKYVLPEKYKYEWSILPEKIKHGYRSGVAYKESDTYLIYWVVAW